MKLIKRYERTYGLPTTLEAILPYACPIEKAKYLPSSDYPCAYILLSNKAEIVYIGHTEHPATRIRSHVRSGRFSIASFVVLGCHWMDTTLIEVELIECFMPVNNISSNPMYREEMAERRRTAIKAYLARQKLVS